MDIYFTIEEWKDLQKYISKSKRKKFLSYFHKALSTRLQNQGLKCWLSCQFNWFKKSKEIWSGTYKCVDTNCKIVYHAKILNDDSSFEFKENINVVIEWNGSCFHQKITQKYITQCRGNARKTLGLEIMAGGISNIQADNVIKYFQSSNKG